MDRNISEDVSYNIIVKSLSARRAWIEISIVIVILRKRNTSLSARRAWIEISIVIVILRKRNVALRKESVDRNPAAVGSLSTHGGSLSARRAWIEM